MTTQVILLLILIILTSIFPAITVNTKLELTIPWPTMSYIHHIVRIWKMWHTGRQVPCYILFLRIKFQLVKLFSIYVLKCKCDIQIDAVYSQILMTSIQWLVLKKVFAKLHHNWICDSLQCDVHGHALPITKDMHPLHGKINILCTSWTPKHLFRSSGNCVAVCHQQITAEKHLTTLD